MVITPGARKKKEQIKSLVSNMSHKLKTPLANLSLYAEILTQEEISPQRKVLFSKNAAADRKIKLDCGVFI